MSQRNVQSSPAFKRQVLRDLEKKGWRETAALNGVSESTISEWKRKEVPTKRPSKYGNCRVEVDGVVFHSAKEAKRYGELKLMERAGEICALELQPRFPLKVNDRLVCTYVADFAYVAGFKNPQQARRIVEDVKGYRTETYKLKAKLFAALHGFEIREV